ncbi:hypothetical protein NQ314_007962, partial [Rhamnusium bicolor]
MSIFSSNMFNLIGMEKINFSGGEPFLPLRGRHLGEMVKFCKTELNLPSVSIVSNGSLIKEKWFQEYGEYVDIMAISCDSFIEDTNKMRFLDCSTGSKIPSKSILDIGVRNAMQFSGFDE